MNIRGTLTYCNRCGFKIFRKGNMEIDEKTLACYWKDVDPIPEGWRAFQNEHLCPSCAKDWKAAIEPVRRNNA